MKQELPNRKGNRVEDLLERIKKKNIVCWYGVEMLRHFFSDNLSRASAELSYYLLFSIFPLLLLTSLILSLTRFSTATLLKIMVLLPEDVQKLLLPSLTRYLGEFQLKPRYGQIIAFGVMAIYFMSRTMSSLVRHVNEIYSLPNVRGSLRQFLFEIATAAGLVLAIGLSFVLNTLWRAIRTMADSLLILPSWLTTLLEYGRNLILPGFIFLFMLTLCYWMPNCKMKWRDAVPGAVFILCAWLVCTVIFTFYFNNFGRYDVIYGSIGAIMVLLLWLYMTGIVILFGFVINFVTMQRRKRNFIYKDQLRMLHRSQKKAKKERNK
ncbi:MAG: YihY/virulence factor BrkB family protein [Butyricicoccus sp.]